MTRPVWTYRACSTVLFLSNVARIFITSNNNAYYIWYRYLNHPSNDFIPANSIAEISFSFTVRFSCKQRRACIRNCMMQREPVVSIYTSALVYAISRYLTLASHGILCRSLNILLLHDEQFPDELLLLCETAKVLSS